MGRDTRGETGHRMTQPTDEQLDALVRELVACPVCTAHRGEFCRDRAGQPVDQHPERDEAAQRVAAALAERAGGPEAWEAAAGSAGTGASSSAAPRPAGEGGAK